MSTVRLQIGMDFAEKQIAAWPVLFRRVHRAHSSWLAQSQVIQPVWWRGFWRTFGAAMEWKTKAPLFYVSFFSFLVPLPALWGGLGHQDGGCIMSWGGFTVRFASSSLSLSPLNVLLHSKASKSLLTGKLWTHRELIRVSARLAICMWISCGCIPGLFMSFTVPQASVL